MIRAWIIPIFLRIQYCTTYVSFEKVNPTLSSSNLGCSKKHPQRWLGFPATVLYARSWVGMKIEHGQWLNGSFRWTTSLGLLESQD
jgi:hypothetical protein